jgi:hypothetical protein
MKKKELIELLEDIAKKDLVDGSDLFDHPCSVAVRALNECFEDIKTLKRLLPKNRAGGYRFKNGNKRIQMLAGLTYDPEY